MALLGGPSSLFPNCIGDRVPGIDKPEPYGTKLKHRFTHKNLADLVGARETVSLILGELAREGLIRQKKICIMILDKERLAQVTLSICVEGVVQFVIRCPNMTGRQEA